MSTNTINTLADIKPWDERPGIGALPGCILRDREVDELRAYAEKLERRVAELEAKQRIGMAGLDVLSASLDMAIKQHKG